MNTQRPKRATPGDVVEILQGRSDAWRKQLINGDRGLPKALLTNCLIALRNAPEWKGVLGYDQFSLSTVSLIPPPWGGQLGPFGDNEDRLTTEWLQNQGIHVSVEVAAQAVQTVAQEHPFHPPRAYLESLTWDGTERAGSWLVKYLGAADSAYARAIGKRWLVSGVARIFRPGSKADSCLILQGPQGLGKSSALRVLGGEWFTDEIADLGSKDAAMQMRGAWIIELANWTA